MKKAQPKIDTSNLKKSRQSPIEIASTNQNYISELEGAQKKYQDIVENVEDMVFEMDTIGRIQYVSPNIEKILGYKPEDIIGEIPTKFMPPDEAREKYAKVLELAAKHKKIKSLEMTYFHKNGSLVILETSAVPFFAKDGTLLGYRGVNRDTTERRRAEESLRRFELIAEHSRDIILFMRRDNGRLTQTNAAAEKAYGYSREELLKLSIHDLRAPETQALTADQMAEADVEGILFETIHRRKDGSTFPVEVSSQGSTIGGVRMLISIIRDITDRKHFEEKLRKSEENYRKIFEEATEGIYQTTMEGRYLNVNPAFARMFGFSSPQDMIDSVTDIGQQLYVDPQTRLRLVQTLTANDKAEGFEAEVCRKDKSKFWISINIHTVRNAAGRILFFEGTNIDITDRKQMEKALRDREERFRSAFDKGAVPMVMTALDGRLIVVNSAYSRMLGYSESELSGVNFYDITHPDDIPANKVGIDAVVRGEKDSFRMEKRYIRKDGLIVWVDMSTSSVRDESNKPLYIVTFAQDITERKRVEEQLQKRESELRLVMNTVPALISYVDPEFRYRRVNEAYHRWFGLKPQDLEGCDVRKVLGDGSWELVRPRMERAMAGETVIYEEHMPYPMGGSRWVQATFVPDFDMSGCVQGVVALITDITARKQVEELLRESEQRFRSYFESPLVGKAISVPDKGIIEVNDQMCSMWGYSRDELLRMKWSDLTHPDDLAADVEQFNRVLAGEIDSYSLDKRYIRKDGKIIWTILAVGCVRDDDGKVIQFAGSVLDITERKRAEEALRESEIRYRMLVDSAPFAIGIHRKEKILYANKVALQLCGAENLEQLQKKSMFDLIHPAYHEPVADRMRRLESGQSLSEEAEFELIRLDSRVVPVEIVAGMVVQYEGGPAIQVTFRDITERKQMELVMQKAKDDLEVKVRERTAQLSEINKSLLAEIAERKRTETELRSAQKNLRAMASEIVFADERSRQQFATDLHDTVVQTLGAAKLRAQFIQDQLSGNAKPILSELENLLSGAIAQARTIMAEMSPPVLNELGLKSALEWLTEQTSKQYGICGNFESRSRSFVLMSREIEILLFQATRELLMNVVKHSKAKNATVKFSSRGQKVRIEVSDDGTGFDIKKTFQPDLKGGYGLYSIRERLRHIGGQLSIKSKPGQGTTIIVSAPREIEK